jgi:hypothetical protein
MPGATRTARRNPEQHPRHHPGGERRTEDAEPDAGERHGKALAEHQPLDVRRSCAERHADADFVRALGDRVRNHAVDANPGQHQRQRRKS